MFTGIIQNQGTWSLEGTRAQVHSDMDLSDVHAGDSIAVNGVCLTTLEAHALVFDLGPETLAITTLGQLRNNSQVHLEKALRLSDRFGGHFVQGHVDGIAEVVSKQPESDSLHITFKTAPELLKICVPKGSVTLDGVSLTLNHIGPETFTVCLVPHTLLKTHLGTLVPGDRVNLENDLIARQVAEFYFRFTSV